MIYDFDDYENPISMMIRQVAEKIEKDREDQIFAAIQEQCQIKIDKFELMRALNYDRDQYNKGFEDAKKKFERPKGKWIKHILSLECSECREKFFCADDDENLQDYDPCKELNFNFCPNCGADMREEEEDD